MDTGNIVQLIGSLGFPIVACGAMFWMLNKQTDLHKQEVDTIKDAIDELRIAIVQLTQRISND